jgi:hypothetical protein
MLEKMPGNICHGSLFAVFSFIQKQRGQKSGIATAPKFLALIFICSIVFSFVFFRRGSVQPQATPPLLKCFGYCPCDDWRNRTVYSQDYSPSMTGKRDVPRAHTLYVYSIATSDYCPAQTSNCYRPNHDKRAYD